MNSVTELTMAVNNTFYSILTEIQLSNLNFSIQMTPFTAYITLKKSTKKDKNGVNTIPSPPVLFLLQEARREITYLKEENRNLKVAAKMYKLESDKLLNNKKTHTIPTDR